MTPKKVTIESEREAATKAACDQIIHRAARMMVEGAGAPIPMMLDRLLTYAAAQACSIDGSPRTAEVFRRLADNIEAGLFHSVTGEGDENGRRH